ncbi:MAG: sugar phosphate isomerase/epimerase [Acidimicrobiales bacterium]
MRTSKPADLPLAATTFGFLYRCGRDDALRQIAAAGYQLVELAAGPPHLDLSAMGADVRRDVRLELEKYGLQCVSTNPLELNPITANPELAEASYRQYRAAIELSADLGAPNVVMISGRMSPLVPMPQHQAKDLLRIQLDRLVPVAQKLGVTMSVEAVPYGFLQTATDIAQFIDEFDLTDVGITLDCANLHFIGCDSVTEVNEQFAKVSVVHISDSWRDRWAHTQVGRAEIDFAAIGATLQTLQFKGPTVYELADPEDPAPRFRSDWDSLSKWGWTA